MKSVGADTVPTLFSVFSRAKEVYTYESRRKARDLFREGYNCAQSVVGAFHEEMGLSLSEATRLASSFGGGMGGLRETCGAVTGMFLVAGMLMGYDDPADYDGKKAHYARIRQLAEQFRQKHDTLVCRELLRSLPEKLQKDPQPRTEQYYKVRPCVRFVETAAELLDEMLQEQ